MYVSHELYAEFLDMIGNTYVEEDDFGGVTDIRGRKAERYVLENAVSWLEAQNFAAVFSAQIGISNVDAAENLTDKSLGILPQVEVLDSMRTNGRMPLVAKPDSSGEEALVILDDPSRIKDYCIVVALLLRAMNDSEISHKMYRI